ncbi:hypothetical protein Efla_007591 [Eimeria flavescens]
MENTHREGGRRGRGTAEDSSLDFLSPVFCVLRYSSREFAAGAETAHQERLPSLLLQCIDSRLLHSLVPLSPLQGDRLRIRLAFNTATSNGSSRISRVSSSSTSSSSSSVFDLPLRHPLSCCLFLATAPQPPTAAAMDSQQQTQQPHRLLVADAATALPDLRRAQTIQQEQQQQEQQEQQQQQQQRQNPGKLAALVEAVLAAAKAPQSCSNSTQLLLQLVEVLSTVVTLQQQQQAAGQVLSASDVDVVYAAAEAVAKQQQQQLQHEQLQHEQLQHEQLQHEQQTQLQQQQSRVAAKLDAPDEHKQQHQQQQQRPAGRLEDDYVRAYPAAAGAPSDAGAAVAAAAPAAAPAPPASPASAAAAAQQQQQQQQYKQLPIQTFLQEVYSGPLLPKHTATALAFGSSSESDSEERRQKRRKRERRINTSATDALWQPHFHPHNQEFRVRYRYKGSMRLKTLSCSRFGRDGARRLTAAFVARWEATGRRIADRTIRSKLALSDLPEDSSQLPVYGKRKADAAGQARPQQHALPRPQQQQQQQDLLLLLPGRQLLQEQTESDRLLLDAQAECLGRKGPSPLVLGRPPPAEEGGAPQGGATKRPLLLDSLGALGLRGLDDLKGCTRQAEGGSAPSLPVACIPGKGAAGGPPCCLLLDTQGPSSGLSSLATPSCSSLSANSSASPEQSSREGLDVAYGGGGPSASAFFGEESPPTRRPRGPLFAHKRPKPLTALSEGLFSVSAAAGGPGSKQFAAAAPPAAEAKTCSNELMELGLSVQTLQALLSRARVGAPASLESGFGSSSEGGAPSRREPPRRGGGCGEAPWALLTPAAPVTPTTSTGRAAAASGGCQGDQEALMLLRQHSKEPSPAPLLPLNVLQRLGTGIPSMDDAEHLQQQQQRSQQQQHHHRLTDVLQRACSSEGLGAPLPPREGAPCKSDGYRGARSNAPDTKEAFLLSSKSITPSEEGSSAAADLLGEVLFRSSGGGAPDRGPVKNAEDFVRFSLF